MSQTLVKARKEYKALPLRQPDTKCNARTRQGGYCKNEAGKRTQHHGTGRCYLHGGNAGGPNKYGIRKNGTPAGLNAKIAYYLEGPGRDKLYDLDTQLARFNGIWDHFTEGGEIKEGAKLTNLIALLEATTRTIHREKQLQLDGGFTHKEWNHLLAIYKSAVDKWIRKHVGYTPQEMEAVMNEIEALAHEYYAENKKKR